jgi:hemerythrin
LNLEWESHLSVGVDGIDEQHKQLIDKFNEFMLAYQEERGSDELYRLFAFLDEYVISHFAYEELMMQQIGYPYYHKHREKHLEFKQKVKTLRERLEHEGATQELIPSAGLLMTSWLIEHMTGMDRAIGKFMIERSERAITSYQSGGL